MEIKLNILAKDVLESSYLDQDDCPITRALARADYPELYHTGLSIRNMETNSIFTDWNSNLSYLDIKVRKMYITKEGWEDKEGDTPLKGIPIVDFEFILKHNSND